MWLGVWAGRRRGELKWEAFFERYHEFRDEDCRDLCANHHAEIHAIYDKLINEDKAVTGRPLSQYTWTQAERLMDKLEAAFHEWVLTVTPGIDSAKYGKQKRQRAAKKRRA